MLGAISVRIALFAIAMFMAHEGRFERAIEMIALTERSPLVRRTHALQDFLGRELREIEAGVPAVVRARAEARGRDLDLMHTRSGLLAELRAGLDLGG
jgi:hypothetical protein